MCNLADSFADVVLNGSGSFHVMAELLGSRSPLDRIKVIVGERKEEKAHQAPNDEQALRA